mmetsp:Transcript_42645/g.91469  ORF Transcript_42645/g.91469 Transcript_42645/m.91469 type:complete len:924 (-) Transcript_42645:216-2987(-)
MTALDLVQAAVNARPDCIGLRFLRTDRTLGALTFRQVWNLSGLIASKLTGSVLAVAIDDGPYLALAELAAWRRGMVLVPLDPHDPVARLSTVIEQANAGCVVTKDWGDAKKLSEVPGPKLLDLSLEAPLGGQEAAPPLPEVTLDPEAAAYMWFTSGSTGQPKGVLVSHRAFRHWCLVKNGPQGITSDNVVLIASASTFDPSIGDIFATWAIGGQVAMAPRMMFFANLGWVMDQLEVTHVTCTPSLWQSLEAGVSLERFSTLCLGGERSPQPLLDQWSPNVTVFNTYGTTECTVWQTLKRMNPGDRATLAGVPYDGNEIQIWARGEMTSVPSGETGEIVQGGIQVGIGYHNRPDLTNEKFVSLPDGSRWYRTGDGGRIVDGELEVMGRFDNQVKIRGMRVELGDIEAGVVKASCGLLSACAVVCRNTFVLAYGQVSTDAAVMMHEPYCVVPVVSDFLLQQASLELPRHMLPSKFILMQKLPLTQNGKVDSRHLPEVVSESSLGGISSLTPMEKVVAGVWGDVLGCSGIGPNDHFLALGGHSSSVLQVSRRLAALAASTGQDVSPVSQAGILLSPEKLIHSPRLRIYCQMLGRGGIRFPGTDTTSEGKPGEIASSVVPNVIEPMENDPAVANLRINYTKHKVKRPRTEEDEELVELDHSAWEQTPQSSDGELLCRASEAGLLPLVKLLVERGAPVEGDLTGQHLRHGLTPLYLATLGNHVCCSEYLLEKTANCRRRDTSGSTMLHKAAERCGERMVKQLLAANAEVDAIDTSSRSTALHAAARVGNLESLKALVDGGAGLDWLDRWNRTPLHWACFHGHLQVVDVLLAAKAETNGTIGESGGRFFYASRPTGVLPQRVAKQLDTLETPLKIATQKLGSDSKIAKQLIEAEAAGKRASADREGGGTSAAAGAAASQASPKGTQDNR